MLLCVVNSEVVTLKRGCWADAVGGGVGRGMEDGRSMSAVLMTEGLVFGLIDKLMSVDRSTGGGPA